MRTINLLSPGDQLLYLSAFSSPREAGRSGFQPEASPPSVENPTYLSLLYLGVKDWGQLLEQASFHRLQPRLYSFLKRNGAPDLLKTEVWGKIESVYRWAQFQVMGLEAELVTRLLPHFNQAGIDTMLLKGAALLQTVYQEKPVRFCIDLDLLIHPENLSKAQTLLGELGYRPNRLSHFPSEWHERELGLMLNREFTFSHPQKGIAVDLHTEPFDESPAFRLKPNWLWEEAVPIKMDGAFAFLPEPTRLFIHLLFHLVKHAGSGDPCLGWLADLDECLLFFGEEIDGGFCRTAIQDSPSSSRMLEVLAFLDSYLGSPLPEKLQQMIKTRGVDPLPPPSLLSPKKSEWALWNDTTWGNRRENFIFYWNRVSGFRKKWAFLFHWVFPEKEYLKVKYPFRTFQNRWAAYFRHWYAMGAKGIGLVFYLLRRKSSCSSGQNRYTEITKVAQLKSRLHK